MSYPAARVDLVGDNVIRVMHPDIQLPDTYLTVASAAGASTVTVQGNSGFSNTDPQDLLLFEPLGSVNAEIVKVGGAITPGTALTVGTLTYAHPINSSITKILFDQVEVSGSATATGSKTVFATVNLTVGDKFTDVIATGTTYAYYFARYKNSLSTTPYFGAYSDAIISTNFAPLTPGFVRRVAFRNVSQNTGGKYDSTWVYDQIYLCELAVTKELKRWSFLEKYNVSLGTVTEGMRSIALPSDIEDPNSQKSILGLRIGTGMNLDYIDLTKFSLVMQNVAQTTTAADILTGATTVTLTDSSNFADADSIMVNGTSYAYTANNRTTNVLSGFAAITLSSTIVSGTQVWQHISEAEPRRYTVEQGTILFDVPPSSTYTNRRIVLDYYKTPTRKTTDAAALDINDPHIYIAWLEMAIKKEKANGELEATDDSLRMFSDRVNKLIKNEMSGQSIRMVPDAPAGLRRPYSWWRR